MNKLTVVFGKKRSFWGPLLYAHQIGRYVGLFRMQYSDRFLPNYQDGELTWPEVAWWISDCCFEGVNSTIEMQRSSTIKYMVTVMENGAPVIATITYLSVLYFKNHIVSYDAKVHQFKIPRVIVYPLYPKNFEGHQFFFYPLAGQSQKQKVKIPRAWTGSHWLLYCTAYFPIIHRNPQLIAMRQPRGRILMHSLDWWYAQQRFIRDTWPQVQDPTAAPNSFKIYWFDLIWLVI